MQVRGIFGDAPGCRIRQDVFYVAGRAAMALDLGHLEAAEREVRRMEQVGSVEPREGCRG
ncbi:hypothetical protein [Streptomyces sp. HO565]|uniref:hypothetical protein n=1 Tax=Streptomyces sp. HO565 TaxID=2857489 RepID=UPI0038B5DAE8